MKTTLLAAYSLMISAFSFGQTITMNDYDFTVPDKWFMQKRSEFILLSQTQSAENGCYLQILPPQPSSGNVEQDAKYVFDQMYPGWQYRFTGEKHDDLSKGHTMQGLEYCMMEAGMSKMSADGSRYDGFEDGAALVIKTGNQMVIIAGRHNRLLACNCHQQYELWGRFFNSFTVKNLTSVKNENENISDRIIGAWVAMGSTAISEYIFTANGKYVYLGAYGTSSKTSDYYYEYIHTKSSAFQGDGSYSLTGNQLKIMRHGDNNPEQVRFRFEKVNHGGTGWKDRLYMLKRNAVDGKEYEVCYEKRKL